MRFYRGISVARQEAEDAVSKIRSQGLKPDDGWWTMMAAPPPSGSLVSLATSEMRIGIVRPQRFKGNPSRTEGRRCRSLPFCTVTATP